jgi:alpha-glucosidase (family GH31 glycosyl hydrolase)
MVEMPLLRYLKMRYQMLPSIVAAGHVATASGFPLVARADLLYPDQAASGASSNEQYLFLNDTLVAPIWVSV